MRRYRKHVETFDAIGRLIKREWPHIKREYDKVRKYGGSDVYDWDTEGYDLNVYICALEQRIAVGLWLPQKPNMNHPIYEYCFTTDPKRADERKRVIYAENWPASLPLPK